MSNHFRDETGFVYKPAWIFLSHSLKDFEKIRQVRNAFEELGARPLMFFLKCITDESELVPLLRREIEARSWFMLCNSKNAAESHMVTQEKEMIKEKKGEKQYEEINIDRDFEKQLEKIRKLVKQATVFISYSQNDKDITEKIADILIENDFGVFFDSYSLSAGDNWEDKMTKAIEVAGHFLILLSPDAIASEFIRTELRSRLHRSLNVIPIIIREPEYVYSQLHALNLMEIQCLDITKGTIEYNITKLIKALEGRS